MITLAIPTYNRRESVVRLVTNVLPAVRGAWLAVVVVDDGSSDGTAEALEPFVSDGLVLVRLAENGGYARAFAVALESAVTDYVLMSADDDAVDLDVVAALQPWLAEKLPDFVSTPFRSSDGTYERARRATAPMNFTEFRDASSHAPGLLYRRESVSEALDFLRAQIDAGNTAALVYPQVVVAAWLCVTGSPWWWGESPVHADGISLPSALVDPAGHTYWAPQSRMSQALGFHDILVDLIAQAPSSESEDRARRLLRLHLRTLYPAMRNAVVATGGPPSGAALDSATLRQLVPVGLRRLGLRR